MAHRFRFSIQTLTLAVLLLGSGGLLWKHWEPWRVCLRMPEHNAPVKVAQFSPDGTRILTFTDFDRRFDEAQSRAGAEDNQVSIFNSSTGERLFARCGSSPVLEFLPATAWFSPGGKWVMAGIDYSRVGENWVPWVKAWRVDNGEELPIPTFSKRAHFLQGSKDDRWFILNYDIDKTICAFDTLERRLVTLNKDSTREDFGKMTADGKSYVSVVTFGDTDNLMLWKVGTWEAEFNFPLPEPRALDSVSRDGTFAVLSQPRNDLRRWDDLRIRRGSIFDVKQRELHRFIGDVSTCVGSPFFPDHERIASIFGGQICISKIGSTQPLLSIYIMEKHKRWALSPDGRAIILDFDDGPKVWDTTTGEPLVFRTSMLRWVSPTLFSPDGERMLSVSGKNVEILSKRRPEAQWGVVCLPEFWAVVGLLVLTIWSFKKDKAKS